MDRAYAWQAVGDCFEGCDGEVQREVDGIEERDCCA
jgi:hypothetical protein